MAIKTLDIETINNIKKTNTSNWNNGNSNLKVSINDKISPNLKVLQNDTTSIIDITSSTTDKVKSKITGTTSITMGDMKKDLGLTSLNISSTTNNTLENNIIDKISNQLTSPGMPINLKNKLSKAINNICKESGRSQLSINFSLRDLLGGYSLDMLLKLLTCLADPVKLTGTLINMLNSDIDTNTVSKGLNTTLATGKVSTSIVSDISDNSLGLNLISTDKSILNNVNKNTLVDNTMSKDEVDTLYNNLPSDYSSMCTYGSNKNGLYDKLLDKKNTTKSKIALSTTPSILDTSTTNKLFMLQYDIDKNKPTIV